MPSDKQSGMLRKLLRSLGLSQGAVGELDFIINYDSKHRMGNDLFEDDE